MTNVLVFAIVLAIKNHVMPVGNQYCKVKLNSYIAQRSEDSL